MDENLQGGEVLRQHSKNLLMLQRKGLSFGNWNWKLGLSFSIGKFPMYRLWQENPAENGQISPTDLGQGNTVVTLSEISAVRFLA